MELLTLKIGNNVYSIFPTLLDGKTDTKRDKQMILKQI